jgi:hypothetical protein
MRTHLFLAAGLAAAIATSASAQVVINEILENPPGGGSTSDALTEYVELYGQPNMDLTGYALVLFKGGEDLNDDGVIDIPPEIDEGFSLDGLSLGSNGLLVLYNGSTSQSFIPLFLPDEGETAFSFFDTHLPSPFDTNGNLGNDGSSTYALVRRRPFHSVVNGVSVYAPGYSVWKDGRQDADQDGRYDYGFEAADAAAIDPMQVIDEIAWSNSGGFEYTRSRQQVISETPGFNPDGVSRVAYYGANPNLGLRLNDEGDTVATRMADEEFVYGEMTGSGLDFLYDADRVGAPTDQNGDGFQDISIGTGTNAFRLTPGGFNDHTPTGINQFRFIAGDLNFDRVVNAADLALLDASLLGADLDATTDLLDDDGQVVLNPNTGLALASYVFQGRMANAFLAARNLSTTDGPGATNAATVTAADRAVLAAQVGPVPCNTADLANPLGTLNFFDVLAYLNAFNAGDPSADLANPTGTLNFFDVLAYLTAFNAGCP